MAGKLWGAAYVVDLHGVCEIDGPTGTEDIRNDLRKCYLCVNERIDLLQMVANPYLIKKGGEGAENAVLGVW